jgi:hypothetical protein
MTLPAPRSRDNKELAPLDADGFKPFVNDAAATWRESGKKWGVVALACLEFSERRGEAAGKAAGIKTPTKYFCNALDISRSHFYRLCGAGLVLELFRGRKTRLSQRKVLALSKLVVRERGSAGVLDENLVQRALDDAEKIRKREQAAIRAKDPKNRNYTKRLSGEHVAEAVKAILDESKKCLTCETLSDRKPALAGSETPISVSVTDPNPDAQDDGSEAHDSRSDDQTAPRSDAEPESDHEAQSIDQPETEKPPLWHLWQAIAAAATVANDIPDLPANIRSRLNRLNGDAFQAWKDSETDAKAVWGQGEQDETTR